MKKFNCAVNKYLKLRHQLGFKLEASERILKKFASFLESKEAPYITIELASCFVRQNIKISNVSKRANMTAIRQFAFYLKGVEKKTEIPPPKLFPCSYYRTNPYIYSQNEIKKLLLCCNKLGQREPILRYTYFNLFGLLAVSGMRVSEAMSLTCSSIDLSNGLITVKNSKFSKSRIIPIHPSTRNTLKKYVSDKSRLSLASKSDFFLFLLQGSSLNIGMYVKHLTVF
jgi:integrase/recombinase XerD